MIAVAEQFFTPLAVHTRRAMAGIPDADLAGAHRLIDAVLAAMREFGTELTPRRPDLV